MAKIFCKNIGDIPGTMKDFAGGVLPSHYLLCDGSTVSQTTYKALFAAIGTTFNTGGEPVGTFRLPNFSRRVAGGSGGSASGTLGNTVGSAGGEETHTLATGEVPAHNHGVTVTPSSNFFQYVFGGGVGGTGFFQAAWTIGTLSGALSNIDTPSVVIANAPVSPALAHNNIQPSLVILKMIKI